MVLPELVSCFYELLGRALCIADVCKTTNFIAEANYRHMLVLVICARKQGFKDFRNLVQWSTHRTTERDNDLRGTRPVYRILIVKCSFRPLPHRVLDDCHTGI